MQIPMHHVSGLYNQAINIGLIVLKWIILWIHNSAQQEGDVVSSIRQ